MAWTIEVAPPAREDLRSILRHLIEVHTGTFDRDRRTARDLAVRRIRRIEAGMARIGAAPHIGTGHEIDGLSIRHVTIDRAVYWFTLDAAARVVRIEAIFQGGQDHLGRMLARLAAEGEAGEPGEKESGEEG